MKRALFVATALLPVLAFGQAKPRAGAGSTFTGGTVTSAIQSATSVTLKSTAADGASAVGAITDTSTAWSNATAKLHSFRTNASEKAYVGAAGAYVSSAAAASGAFIQSLNAKHCFDGTTCAHTLKWDGASITSESNIQSSGNILSIGGSFTGVAISATVLGGQSDGASAVAVKLDSPAYSTTGAKLVSVRNNGAEKANFDKDGNLQAGGTTNPVPVVHSAQTTSAVAMEFGKSAATANALAVTFSTAFSVAPSCTCADNNATPAACGISTAATTTAVTFKGTTGATDVISWICIGAK